MKSGASNVIGRGEDCGEPRRPGRASRGSAPADYFLVTLGWQGFFDFSRDSGIVL